MNSAQAKQLSLPEIMERLGFEPTSVKNGGQELWYRSPFREEKEASFHTSFLGGKWIWNDFGDEGGTVIDFVMRFKGFQQVNEALGFLEEMYRGRSFKQSPRVAFAPVSQPSLFSFQQQEKFFTPPEAASHELEFLEALPIRNPLIYSYLTNDRAIPRQLIDMYLKEVRYRNRGKEYFAIGMENNSGGYEIRAASDTFSFKSALVKRDITVIKGTVPDRKAVSVFEGMTDFLSLLTMMKMTQLAGDAVIMHSLSSYPRTVEFLRGQDYSIIHTFLDNDRPGQECTERFKVEFGDRAVSQSGLFAPYSDINDALKANQVPEILQR